MRTSRKVYDKSYKQRKTEKTAKKLERRITGCNCYLREQGNEALEKQYHDPFCGVWLIGAMKHV